MDKKTLRARRRVDWISHARYEAGIMRFGRVYIPGSWVVTPTALALFGTGMWWLISALIVGDGGVWLPFASIVAPILLLLIFFGSRPAIQNIREASDLARRWAEGA